MNLTQFEAILFDLDSTLINTYRYPLKVAEWLLSKSGDQSSRYEEFVRQLIKNYFNGIAAVANGGPYTRPFEVVRAAMRQTLIDLCLKVDEGVLEEATHLFKRLHVDSAALYPGVEELVRTLSDAGIKLGVITNSFEDNVDLILRKLNILDRFSVTVDGGHVKAFKPLPKIFHFAMEQLGTSPMNTLYVGDEFWADIVGASSVGMTTVWVNHRGNTLDDVQKRYKTDVVPALTISAISELREYL
ncbi:MAG: HAD family hydrolase [Candidatus Thorarchaeota archaeon]